MKLEEKRLVVEALLIAGDSFGPTAHSAALQVCDSSVDDAFRFARRVVRRRRSAFSRMMATRDYVDSCIEAAYLVIESSPTLRCEWFGAP